MRYLGKSDVGRQRTVNEDMFGAKLVRNGSGTESALVAVVCDGMGGAAGGELASAIGLDVYLSELSDNVEEYLKTSLKRDAALELPRLIVRSVGKANRFLNKISRGDPGLHGMGTTLVSALLYKGVLYACNIGDSRLYHVYGDKIEQVTRDHSYVQYLIDRGRISPEEGRLSDKKNIITRALGVEAEVEADLYRVELRHPAASMPDPSEKAALAEKSFGRAAPTSAAKSAKSASAAASASAARPANTAALAKPFPAPPVPGGGEEDDEYLLLCTDGLSNSLTDREILAILRAKITLYDELEVKTNLLIQGANRRGGADNITVLLIKV